MSLQSLARQFVEMCNAGKNFEVMEQMYSPDIVSVEGDGAETKGKGPVIEKSRKWVSDKAFNGEKVLGPYFNGANQFAVHYSLDITPNATGKQVILTEVAVYTVANDKITREVFYYDGEH